MQDVRTMAGGMGAAWSQLDHAIVYFWDHIIFAPGVVLNDVGETLRTTLAASIAMSKRSKGVVAPGKAAVHLTWVARERELDVGLVNVPVGGSTGQIFGRLTSGDSAIGGCGIIIVDIAAEEVIVFGGFGFNFKEDFNAYEKRIYTLEDLKLCPSGREEKKKQKKKGPKKEEVEEAEDAVDDFSAFVVEVEGHVKD